MKNRLEAFVETNRDAFDTDLPGTDLWKRIENAPRKQDAKIFRFLTRTQAAAVLLVILNAAVIFFLLQRKDMTMIPGQTNKVTEQLSGQTLPATEETLEQYNKLIEIKQAGLKEIEKSNPVLYKKFVAALDQLNSVYRELEQTLEQTPNKETVLEAMIQNLSLQQELLNQQLSIYQKIKQNQHEKATKNI